MKTADDVKVGDIVLYEFDDDSRREVHVTEVTARTSTRTAHFTGKTFERIEIFGECNQIVKYLAHA